MQPDQDVEHAQAWLRKADSDFRTLELLLRADDAPWDVVCFHAQQAAEKCIKALLVAARIPVPRVHDLLELVFRLPDGDRLHAEFGDLAELSHAAVTTRYPDAEIAWDRPLAERLAKQARRVREVVQAEIGA